MTFAFIEASGRRAVRRRRGDRRRARTRCRRSTPCCGRRCCQGSMDAASHNRRREHHDVRLFETGTRFSRRARPAPSPASGAARRAPPHWSGGEPARVTSSTSRAWSTRSAARSASRSTFAPAARRAVLRRGRAASWLQVARSVVRIGVSARSRRRFSTRAVFPATKRSTRSSSTSTRWQHVQSGDDLRAESLPRFPSVVRDLSVLVDSTLPAAAVRGTIRSAAPAALAQVDRIRSLPRQGRAGRPRQPVAPSHVPLRRSAR